jgi:hypothetical protein
LPFERELEIPMDSSDWLPDPWMLAQRSSRGRQLRGDVASSSRAICLHTDDTSRREYARLQPPLEAGADLVRVQPRAKEFAPPNHLGVGSGAARDIDIVYRELTDRKSRTPVSNPGKQ